MQGEGSSPNLWAEVGPQHYEMDYAVALTLWFQVRNLVLVWFGQRTAESHSTSQVVFAARPLCRTMPNWPSGVITPITCHLA